MAWRYASQRASASPSPTPEGGTEALLSNADIAMYHAKAAGKNRHVTFKPQMQDMLHERCASRRISVVRSPTRNSFSSINDS